ncbi:MAG: hypothetical protein WC723_02885 [Candidatus Omnitrophota bacterium]
MERKKISLIALLAAVLFISGCTGAETDAQFTKRVFNGLVKGNQKIQDSIDWEKFKAFGIDTGQAYSNIVSEKERADYRKIFLYNCAFTFRAAKGKPAVISNWRVKSREGDNTIVAADTPVGKALLFTLTFSKGKRKLAAINWQQ